MRSSLVHLLATFAASSALLVAAPSAFACDAGAEANVSFAINVVGGDASEDDVTVNYYIEPYAQPDDGGDPIDPCEEDPDDPECIDPCEEDPDDPECIDPCEEDPDDPECIDPCEEDPDAPECVDPCEEDPDDPECVDPCEEDPDAPECVDPCEEDPDAPECVDPCEENPGDPECEDGAEEPISGSLTVGLGSDERFELPAGEADFEFELDGYETTVVHRSLCGDTTVRATLMSDEALTFSAYVGRWQGDVPATDALVTLHGAGERLGERYEGEVDEEGMVEIEGVPAGLYAVEIWLPLGNSHELLHLDGVDILEDTHLSTRLRSSIDRPDYKITCAAFSTTRGGAPGLGTMMLALFVMGQLVVLRRRDG